MRLWTVESGFDSLLPSHSPLERLGARTAGAGATRFLPGDRVGIAWLRGTCGSCVDCRSGRENLCGGSRYTGWDDDAAPLLCAGIIGYRALRRSRVQPGQKLGLYGFGSSAHIVAQLARHRGCEIHVATRSAAHRRMAEELGAVWTGDAHDVPPARLDGAIVFAPAGEVVPPALRALGKGGTLAVAGIHMSDIPALDYDRCLFHEKTLTSVTSNTRADGEELLREAAKIPIRPWVTTFPLSEANDALLRLANDGIRGTAVLFP